MATSFGSSQSFLLTSESVTEGHPDKVCDQVSDAVLDGMLSQDAHARVACETAITKGLCVVIGEVTTHADLDIQRTIRDTIRGIGYNLEEIGFDADHALTQVTGEYELGKPKRIEAIVVSTHHSPDASQKAINDGVRSLVIDPVLEGMVIDANTKIMVNPSGKFIVGGPAADAGLTGRKIIVDTYGGIARHGGGAFSGKDPSKVDRSAAYAARYVAKNLVAAGLAERCEVQVSYAIGRAHPTSIAVETFGTGSLPERELLELVRRHFDLRPAAIIANMNLMRPIYRPTAAYGHFGRDDLGVPWELTDKVDALRADASVLSRAVD